MAVVRKKCPACKELLPISRFHPSPSRGRYRQPYCKPCTTTKVKEWRHANKDKTRAHYQNAKGQRRRNRHKLSKDAEARLYGIRGNHCWVCGAGEGSKLLCFDHDHDSGLVRGLLCTPCNLVLGNAKDNPALLRRAASYLEGRLVENKKWIQGAIKKPGALKKSLGVKKGEKIPAKKLAAAAKKPGKMGQRARLAQTLKKMKK
jgi:hypothetical protein